MKTENFSCTTGHSRTPFAFPGKETVHVHVCDIPNLPQYFDFVYLHVRVQWKLEVAVSGGPGIANIHLELALGKLLVWTVYLRKIMFVTQS